MVGGGGGGFGKKDGMKGFVVPPFLSRQNEH